MAHAELAGWLTSVITEAKQEADYRLDARDVLAAIEPSTRVACSEEQTATRHLSTGEKDAPTTPRHGYSFTVPAAFVRFTVRATDEIAAETTARSLSEQVHELDELPALGVEVTEISFADSTEVERDDSPAETDVREWTVIGVRWNESPESVVALTALPGRQQPANHDVSDELSGWVRHVHAPNADAALRAGKASAASAPSVAAFLSDES